MGSKPSSQQQTSSSYTPPPAVLQNYTDVTNQAKSVAATPYSAYGGQLVSPINSQQTAGIGAVNAASGIQDPYNSAAGGLAASASTAIDPETVNSQAISQYESPYNTDVVNATEAEIQNQNQQQSAALKGNAISSGAFGGDRAGVAQAALAGQQDIAENATLANLNNQNYSQALGEANTQQTAGMTAQQETAANRLAASQQLGNLGSAAQTEALNEANAQTNAGTLEQTTQQAQDTAAYNQFLQQQAYPFETTGWLANIVEGIGSQSGGTTTGTSQTNTSTGSQVAGGLLGLASFLARGGRVPNGSSPDGQASQKPHRDQGGGIIIPSGQTGLAGAMSAAPYSGVAGWVPQTGALAIGHTAPAAFSGGQQAQSPQQQGQEMAQTAKAVQTLGSGLGNGLSTLSSDASALSGGLAGTDFGGLFSRGGKIRNYDDGGVVPQSGPEWVEPPLAYYEDLGSQVQPSAPLPMTPPQGIGSDIIAPADQTALPGTPQGVADIPVPVSRPPALGAVPSAQDEVSQAGGIVPTTGPTVAIPAIGGLPGRPENIPSSSPYLGGVTSGAADSGNPIDALKNNIANKLESGGNYSAVGPTTSAGDNAYGKYQVMGANIPSWTKQILGTEMTPQQFLGNPQAQEKVASAKLGEYYGKTGNLPDTASMWFTGRPLNAGGASAHDVNGMTGGKYAEIATSGLPGQGPQLQPQAQTQPQGGFLAGVKNDLGSVFGVSPASAQEAPGGQQFSTPQYPKDSPTPSSGRTGLLGLNISPETRQLMLSAGLGIMGGTSRSALTNIGQGGLQGIQAVMSQGKTAAETGLIGAQTQSAQAEADIKKAQVQFMMNQFKKSSDQSQSPQSSSSDVTAPGVTKGNTQVPPSGVSNTGETPSVASGAVASDAVAAQLDSRLGPQYRYALQNSQNLLFPALAESGRIQLQQAQKQLPEGYAWGPDGHVVANPEAISQQGVTEGVKAAAGESGKQGAQPHTVFLPDGSPVTASGQDYQGIAKAGGGYINGQPVTLEQSPYLKPNVDNYAKFKDDGLAFTQAYQPARQQLSALADIYSKYQAGRGSEALADLTGYAQRFGLPVPDLTTGFDAATKTATTEALSQLASSGITRAPALGIKAEMSTVANPDMSPAARYKVITDMMGKMDFQKAQYDAVLGSGTHDIYSGVSKFNKENDYQGYLNNARTGTPAPVGMTPESSNVISTPKDVQPQTSQGPVRPSQAPGNATLIQNPKTGAYGWSSGGHIWGTDGTLIR